MLSFIHTGDLHLGRPFRKMGRRVGDGIRRAQIETLSRIVNIVRTTQSDFLLIAGDLFDSNSVSTRLVSEVMQRLASLTPIPVYILPGNHDVLDSSSVYSTVINPLGLPSNVEVISEKPCTFHPTSNATVFSVASKGKKGGERPLREISVLASDSCAKYKVAMVHASVKVPGLSIHPDEPQVTFEDISSSSFDYVAMGHWHSHQDWSRGNTKAFYCGTPETLGFDEEPSPGTVSFVRIKDDSLESASKVTVEKKRVGTYRWVKLDLDLNLIPDRDSLITTISQYACSQTLIRLKLKGDLFNVKDWSEDFTVPDLQEQLEPLFFYIEIDDKKLDLHQLTPKEFPPNSIGRAFYEIITEQIQEQNDPMQKDILEEVLRRGSLYLSGKGGIRL